MKLISFLTAILAVAVPSAIGQTGSICGNGADDTYLACLGNSQNQIQIACGSLANAGGRPYFQCMCDNMAYVLNCYNQCPAQRLAANGVRSDRQAWCDAAATAGSIPPPTRTTTSSTVRPSTSSTATSTGSTVGNSTLAGNATSTAARMSSTSSSSTASTSSNVQRPLRTASSSGDNSEPALALVGGAVAAIVAALG
ncbi:hypothetical protein BCR44DRAFT_1436848 [Catenaria anguillulae PL171]|uniref:Extracellular membrane protein CFEM domain-containing protein n=1 Tax=Catenaria anguillulae PL171 TaxID=765915 RepID=A0A1Y2HI07_9FUNG|nr:hypothetical protein BCR44DRAFT_1436848 [Catenaria anguillulae PL171]